MMHCDFCGLDFEPECSAQTACNSCPIHNGCAQIICPRCGYHLLPEAALLRWWRQTAARWRSKQTTSTQTKDRPE